MQVPLIRLQCGCNSYDWGKKGNTSAAAKYAAATPRDDFSIQQDKPYAELWMGTHPSLPSKDLETGRSLLEMIQDNESLMGNDITKKYHNKLPFLFKVLSIAKALSIQAHPNKKLAEQLHAKDPKNYPDDNHKPEMTIAITPFEGLCGFRPLKEIAYFLDTIGPLHALVGKEHADELKQVASSENVQISQRKAALRKAFTALMKQPKDSVASMSKQLVAMAEASQIQPGPSVNTAEELNELVVRCNAQFPGDIGLFNLFFLNFVKLEPGQAMYLKADDIHAYISGDIIECMASSDNVIRAGFTPKFQDVNTLTDILTYDHEPAEQQLLKPVDYPYVTLNTTAYSSNSSSLLYDPPIEEFSVVRTALNKTGAKATFEGLAGPSIVIATNGSGKISVGPKKEDLKEGYVYFVGATAELVIESESDELVTFRAFCEIDENAHKANGAH